MPFDGGSIVGKLQLNLDPYTTSILKAQSLTQVFGSTLTSLLATPMLGIANAAKEAGEAILHVVTGASRTQREVGQMASALGVSVEFLSGWGLAAERSGESAESLTHAMTFLSRAAKEAITQGGGAADHFKQLGVSLADAQGKILPIESLLRKVADGMSKMGPGVERTGIAMDLFGRGGAKMIEFLSQGSSVIDGTTDRLGKMGAITTASAARSAKAFDELFIEVGQAWNGILNKIAEPVRDALGPYLNNLITWMQTHPEKMKEIIQKVSDAIVKAFDAIGKVVIFLVEHIDVLVNAMGAAGIGLAAAVAVKAIAGIQSAFVLLIPAIEAATAAQLAFNAAKAGLIGAGIGGAVGALGGQSGIGGAIGGGLGAIIGNLLLPGIGGYIGGAIGTAAGVGIESATSSEKKTTNINVSVATVEGDSPEEVARKTQLVVTKKMKEERQKAATHSTVSRTLGRKH